MGRVFRRVVMVGGGEGISMNITSDIREKEIVLVEEGRRVRGRHKVFDLLHGQHRKRKRHQEE